MSQVIPCATYETAISLKSYKQIKMLLFTDRIAGENNKCIASAGMELN